MMTKTTVITAAIAVATATIESQGEEIMMMTTATAAGVGMTPKTVAAIAVAIDPATVPGNAAAAAVAVAAAVAAAEGDAIQGMLRAREGSVSSETSVSTPMRITSEGSSAGTATLPTFSCLGTTTAARKRGTDSSPLRTRVTLRTAFPRWTATTSMVAESRWI